MSRTQKPVNLPRRHLRPGGKRVQSKSERQAGKREIAEAVSPEDDELSVAEAQRTAQ